MYHKINEELLQAEENVLEKQRLERLLTRAQQSLDKEKLRLLELEQKVKKEGYDLEKLEGKSLTSLFHDLIGNKVEKLDKERTEYLEVKLKYDEASYAVDALTKETEELEGRVAVFSNTELKLRRIIEAKERQISSSQGEAAVQLDQFTSELASAKAAQREVQEALAAGNAARASLDTLVGTLNSASNWGTWDMLGGGLLATAAKHSRMDEAKWQLHQVQQDLRRFQRELADVEIASAGAELELDSFASFADFFFDGLIVDWVVQGKIERSLGNSRKAYHQVQQALEDLDNRQKSLSHEVEKLEEKRQQFVREV
ncbi:MAG: hypothetical protein EHM41_15930 [Chloroflexi bacterium]|nr:MAG: hypothetical protein EHM41_15930 [Chloroflexota bacterium]